MCNPQWTNLPAGCVLRVDVAVEGSVAVGGELVTTFPDGRQTRQDLTRGDFPLERQVQSRVKYEVTVNAALPGEDGSGKATVTATITNPARTDVCELSVDKDHTLDSEIITAKGA
jgi:hypothetical protein